MSNNENRKKKILNIRILLKYPCWPFYDIPK